MEQYPPSLVTAVVDFIKANPDGVRWLDVHKIVVARVGGLCSGKTHNLLNKLARDGAVVGVWRAAEHAPPNKRPWPGPRATAAALPPATAAGVLAYMDKHPGLAHAQRGMAAALGVTRSSVGPVLFDLEEAGQVHQVNGGRWRLGPALVKAPEPPKEPRAPMRFPSLAGTDEYHAELAAPNKAAEPAEPPKARGCSVTISVSGSNLYEAWLRATNHPPPVTVPVDRALLLALLDAAGAPADLPPGSSHGLGLGASPVNHPKPAHHALLLRPSADTDGEFDALAAGGAWYHVAAQRTDPRLHGRTVIARYAALPFYQELHDDLVRVGARLANTPAQHRWIADVAEWAATLGPELTPPAYDATNYYHLPDRAYVLKGRTNSRKGQWNTHMFAPDLAAVPRVLGRLYDDPNIAAQGVVLRPYVPLVTYDTNAGGCPVANEWRTFWWGGSLVSSGWYWANFPEHEPAGGTPYAALMASRNAAYMARDVMGDMLVCIDVAQRLDDGKWIVVDVNDGQQSGLGGIDPVDFYQNLANAAWVRET